jgi:hypothetical protein
MDLVSAVSSSEHLNANMIHPRRLMSRRRKSREKERQYFMSALSNVKYVIKNSLALANPETDAAARNRQCTNSGRATWRAGLLDRLSFVSTMRASSFRRGCLLEVAIGRLEIYDSSALSAECRQDSVSIVYLKRFSAGVPSSTLLAMCHLRSCNPCLLLLIVSVVYLLDSNLTSIE